MKPTIECGRVTHLDTLSSEFAQTKDRHLFRRCKDLVKVVGESKVAYKAGVSCFVTKSCIESVPKN